MSVRFNAKMEKQTKTCLFSLYLYLSLCLQNSSPVQKVNSAFANEPTSNDKLFKTRLLHNTSMLNKLMDLSTKTSILGCSEILSAMHCWCTFNLFYAASIGNLSLMLCVKVTCLCRVLLCQQNLHVVSVSPFPGNILVSVKLSRALK